jgi:hypothetical protein
MTFILKIGQKVRHKSKKDWGVGEIVEVKEGEVVTVKFDAIGELTIAQGSNFLKLANDKKEVADIGIFKTGDRIKHVKNPAWGIGEVLEDSTGEFVKAFFSNAGEKLLLNDINTLECVEGEDAFDAVLDNLSYKYLSKEKKIAYSSPENSIKKFLEVFPKGFEDKLFLENERDYKIEAHILMKKLLNQETFSNLIEKDDFNEVCTRALKIVNKTNLIFPNEKMVLKGGLKAKENQKLFSLTLYELIYGNDLRNSFIKHASALEEIGAAKWTIISYFLFVAKPGKYMFVKPTVTQHAAEMMRFEINYKPELNWVTYESVLKLSELLNMKLIEAEIVPRDMIDVQSFMWAITAY